jgi:hypothetical protein
MGDIAPLPASAWTSVSAIAAGVTAAITLITALVTRVWPWYTSRRAFRNVASSQGVNEFTLAQFSQAVRYYVEPACGPVDPAGAEDYRQAFTIPVGLFRALDEAILERPSQRFLFLLADSGMGKTSGMLNYYSRNLGRRRRVPMAIFYLGRPGVVERIGAIGDPGHTVLLLDALDEDPKAIDDHADRIRELATAASSFRSVIISCRSQFFSAEEEITQETGVINIGPRSAGEGHTYKFNKLYIAPLNNTQVSRYLRRRLGLLNRGRRAQARRVVEMIGDLSARPMLLAYVEDLLDLPVGQVTLSAAYSRIVDAWIERERDQVGKVDALLSFSEQLAVDVILNRVERGGEHVSKKEILALAARWGIDLEGWKLTGRSLLNRDAIGRFKFAHRSILEFLFVRSFVRGNALCLGSEWTDQMLHFLADGTEPGGLWYQDVPALLESLRVSPGTTISSNAGYALSLLIRSRKIALSSIAPNTTPPRASLEGLRLAIEHVVRAQMPSSVHFDVLVERHVDLPHSEGSDNGLGRRRLSQRELTGRRPPASAKAVAGSDVHAESEKPSFQAQVAEHFTLDFPRCSATVRILEPDAIEPAVLDGLHQVIGYWEMWEEGQRLT